MKTLSMPEEEYRNDLKTQYRNGYNDGVEATYKLILKQLSDQYDNFLLGDSLKREVFNLIWKLKHK